MNMLVSQKQTANNIFNDDVSFDELYPKRMQEVSRKHWTRLEVAKCAADFLASEKDAHILDIGSGIGKFCISAAHFKPHALFYGIEQRKDLVQYAMDCSKELNIQNVSFIHGNFTQLDLRQFNHFYFYNSFYENIAYADKIDNKIQYSSSLYNYYNRYLYKQLEQMPSGTRIATFHSLEEEIPPDYYVVKTHFDKLLKFWIKI